MKKALRFIGVLAGLGTVIWVMRDRFISLALPREPDPPIFRVAPQPPPAGETASQEDDLTIVKGVGPVYAARLQDAGIRSLAQLAAAPAATLSATVDVPVGRVSAWIDEAAFLSSFQGN